MTGADVDHYWQPGQKNDPSIEFWYPIAGFEGLYEISSYGRVRRIAGGRGTCVKNGRPHVMSCRPNSAGYPLVNLYRGDGTRRTAKVHILVMETFGGEVPAHIAEEYEVHHGDADKENNGLHNLGYTSKFDNLQEQYQRWLQKTGRCS